LKSQAAIVVLSEAWKVTSLGLGERDAEVSRGRGLALRMGDPVHLEPDDAEGEQRGQHQDGADRARNGFHELHGRGEYM
jgi:hypothetical protein